MDKSKVIPKTEILIERISKSSVTISNKDIKALAERWVADNYGNLVIAFSDNRKEQEALEYLYKSVHNRRILKSKWLKNVRIIYKWLKRSNYSDSSSAIYFDPGKPFTAYRILRDLFSKAKTEVLIYDGYVEEGTLDILSAVPKSTEIKILTNNTYGKFNRELAKFKIEFSNCVARKSTSVHDRFFFMGRKCFVVGTSLHSLGKNKASHIFNVPPEVADILRSHFDSLWGQATVL